jgi:hypothetical protein
MKFKDLQNSVLFVVIVKGEESQLLAKNVFGKIMIYHGWAPLENHNITDDTEVQAVSIK